MNQIEKVKAIPIREVFRHYGFEIGRGGFCRCPFHQERTPSCKVYADSFYCFGCGAHGDSIDFVRQYDRLGFLEAVDKLCSEFGISYQPKSMAQKISDGKEAFIRRKKQAERENKRAELLKAWQESILNLRYAEKVFSVFEPQNMNDEWTYAFCEAVRNLERAQNKADIAMEELNSFEQTCLQT